ncbi:DUF5009 domain-containing protein [Marivirga lumbricoides]|uniref:DUF5009 domain-containing protein n=1 Tax=Marivirga lumbricoides TaxID=1046115 RepID=A0ABQ1N6E7_9BACT|nr:DUF5009 domain-containing protein [Marivirga lumbricoides]
MSKSDRLLSLDVFRGITIVGMIIVNDPGSWEAIYMPFKHAEWNGCTPTDLVFPFFLFIVGVAISLALKNAKEDVSRHNTTLWHLLKRSGTLFLIGLFLNAFPEFHLESLRIPGVLQRIAIVFFIGSVFYLKTNWKTQVVVASMLLLVYWALMMLVSVPGVGIGMLEPGRNLAAFVDELLLKGHMWASTETWDPEGILSTLPAIASGLFGILAGQWIRYKQDKKEMLLWLFFAGNIYIVLGLLWDLSFPINKSLWTSSYVVFTTGIALNLFAMLYWLLDIRKNRSIFWKPFEAFGTNAIFAYILSVLLQWVLGVTLQNRVYHALVAITGNDYLSSLIWALLFTAIMLIPVWVLYRKRIIIKV